MKKDELIVAIGVLAVQLELADVETEGLTNPELESLLDSLKTQNEAKENDAAETKKEKKVKSFPYVVAPGHSVLCLKGSINAGQEMKALYLTNDKDDLKVLIKKGVVIKG